MRPLKSAGFTLLELLIAITILSILSAFAIPSYQNYLQRARFSELILSSAALKTMVAVALQEGYPMSEINSGQHGIPNAEAATENIQDINVKKGIIIATGTKKLKQATYILTPNEDATSWNISGSCLEMGLCK